MAMRHWVIVLAILAIIIATSQAVVPSDTFEGYVTSQGYPVESHWATTEDGYILGLFRMPSKTKNAPVVLLQHGILASAWCWVINDKNHTPAFQLWELGYDVWLSNSRGNDFSLNHTHLSADSDAFWDFTFEQMPLDVLANTRYVLNATRKESLSYIGWSQGTTQMFIAALLYPELTAKINLFAALSPVVYLVHTTSALLKAAAEFRLADAIYAVYKQGFLEGSKIEHEIEVLACTVTLGALCKISVDTVCGVSALDDSDMIKNLAAHFPAGTSTKDFVHFAQYIKNASFARFDYGKEGNLAKYGQATAPSFDLTVFPPIPTALFHGTQDALVAAEDFALEQSQLAKAAGSPVVFDRAYEGLSHVSWFVGKPAAFGWFADLAALLKKHSAP